LLIIIDAWAYIIPPLLDEEELINLVLLTVKKPILWAIVPPVLPGFVLFIKVQLLIVKLRPSEYITEPWPPTENLELINVILFKIISEFLYVLNTLQWALLASIVVLYPLTVIFLSKIPNWLKPASNSG